MTSSGWSDAGYEAIASLLGVRAGLSFRQSQRATIEDAIRRAMRDADAPDLTTYLRQLQAFPKKLDDLLVKATVGETYFFRDPGQLEVIRKTILPDICNRVSKDHTLRLWSAGCASGEEAYSLAMLLDQLGMLSRASVLGTDISRAALEQAKVAVYRDWSLRGEGTEFATPYLEKSNERNSVKKLIREAVHFEYLNLALDNYPSTATGTRGVDLILCRNVMIYFDRDTIKSVIARFHRCLAVGGWLVTASSDPPVHEMGLFEVITTKHGMYYRKGADKFPRQQSFLEATATPKEDRDAQIAQASIVEATKIESTVKRQLAEAKRAIAAGDYELSAALTGDLLENAEAAIIHVKALANQNIIEAEQASTLATQHHPLSKELHYLHAVLLMDLNRHSDAADALRRVLYLDRSLALAHFSLGTVLRTIGKIDAAQRALRSAYELCILAEPSELVPLGEDEKVGDLLEIIKLQLETLNKVADSQKGVTE